VTDLILAALHHLLVFALVALIAIEFAIVRPGMSGETIARASLADRLYGGVAGAVVIVGILRVIFGIKGWEYYVGNHMFWGKMVAFVAIGLLSVPPTIRVARWQRIARSQRGFTPPAGEIAFVRQFIWLEALLLIPLLIFAASMARGYG
jgi:putative membrane protein